MGPGSHQLRHASRLCTNLTMMQNRRATRRGHDGLSPGVQNERQRKAPCHVFVMTLRAPGGVALSDVIQKAWRHPPSHFVVPQIFAGSRFPVRNLSMH